MEPGGSPPEGEFWSPGSRLTPEDDASRAHHTEEGVWLQLNSMVIKCSFTVQLYNAEKTAI